MRVGLDIGSTTIKCVVLDDADCIVYSTYERHYSHILEKGRELLTRVARAGGVRHPCGGQPPGARHRLHH